MKKLFFTILICLTIAASFSVFSQGKPSNTVSKEQTVSYLISQNEKAQDLITAQNLRIETLEAELAGERENSQSISKSYELAQRELALLQQSNEALSRAIALNEQTIAAISSDRDKWKDNAKKHKKGKYKAYIAIAAAVALKFLIP